MLHSTLARIPLHRCALESTKTTVLCSKVPSELGQFLKKYCEPKYFNFVHARWIQNGLLLLFLDPRHVRPVVTNYPAQFTVNILWETTQNLLSLFLIVLVQTDGQTTRQTDEQRHNSVSESHSNKHCSLRRTTTRAKLWVLNLGNDGRMGREPV